MSPAINIKHTNIMANINLSQVSYVDYVASLYLAACQVSDVRFTPKTVKVDGEDVVLVHVEGVQRSTGVIVNFDMWPRNNAAADDLANLPKVLDDVHFRVGYYPAIDGDGNQTLREGKPKWIAYVSGGKKVVFEGGKREFGE